MCPSNKSTYKMGTVEDEILHHPVVALNHLFPQKHHFRFGPVQGKPPNQTFTCYLEVPSCPGLNLETEGPTKRDAKTLIARKALDVLQESGRLEGMLAEIAERDAKKKPTRVKEFLKHPVVALNGAFSKTLDYEIMPDPKIFGDFICTVAPTGQVFEGRARGKKAAKLNCAEAALKGLNLEHLLYEAQSFSYRSGFENPPSVSLTEEQSSENVDEGFETHGPQKRPYAGTSLESAPPKQLRKEQSTPYHESTEGYNGSGYQKHHISHEPVTARLNATGRGGFVQGPPKQQHKEQSTSYHERTDWHGGSSSQRHHIHHEPNPERLNAMGQGGFVKGNPTDCIPPVSSGQFGNPALAGKNFEGKQKQESDIHDDNTKQVYSEQLVDKGWVGRERGWRRETAAKVDEEQKRIESQNQPLFSTWCARVPVQSKSILKQSRPQANEKYPESTPNHPVPQAPVKEQFPIQSFVRPNSTETPSNENTISPLSQNVEQILRRIKDITQGDLSLLTAPAQDPGLQKKESATDTKTPSISSPIVQLAVEMKAKYGHTTSQVHGENPEFQNTDSECNSGVKNPPAIPDGGKAGWNDAESYNMGENFDEYGNGGNIDNSGRQMESFHWTDYDMQGYPIPPQWTDYDRHGNPVPPQNYNGPGFGENQRMRGWNNDNNFSPRQRGRGRDANWGNIRKKPMNSPPFPPDFGENQGERGWNDDRFSQGQRGRGRGGNRGYGPRKPVNSPPFPPDFNENQGERGWNDCNNFSPRQRGRGRGANRGNVPNIQTEETMEGNQELGIRERLLKIAGAASEDGTAAGKGTFRDNVPNFKKVSRAQLVSGKQANVPLAVKKLIMGKPKDKMKMKVRPELGMSLCLQKVLEKKKVQEDSPEALAKLLEERKKIVEKKKSPLMVLHEIAGPLPFEFLFSPGLQFTCSLEVGDKKFTSTKPSKKHAKLEVAKAALVELGVLEEEKTETEKVSITAADKKEVEDTADLENPSDDPVETAENSGDGVNKSVEFTQVFPRAFVPKSNYPISPWVPAPAKPKPVENVEPIQSYYTASTSSESYYTNKLE